MGLLRTLLFSFFLLFISSSILLAQDIHFSQYLSAPQNLNPSFTGDFVGEYRLTGNYRNQWNSITVPYETYGIGGDAASVLGMKNLGLGASLYYDHAGDGQLTTTIVQVSGAYAYPLTKDSTQKIYFGLMPSFVRQEVDFSRLYFDNQYNDQLGQYDPSLSNNEQISQQSTNYINLAAGMRWKYEISKRNILDIGFAGYNLTEPSNEFTSSGNKTLRRLNAHGNFQFKTLEKLDLIPGVLYSTQGSAEVFLSGISARYLYNGYTAFHLGYWYRNEDAGFMSAGLTYQTLYIGLSYDINTSGLREVSNGRGAFEISLIYVFRKFRPKDGKYISCPNYL